MRSIFNIILGLSFYNEKEKIWILKTEFTERGDDTERLVWIDNVMPIWKLVCIKL